MRPVPAALGALILFGNAGCGTVQNLRSNDALPPPDEVYGGVALAARSLKAPSPAQPMAPLLWPIQAGDVVLSAVGDTLTLPFTLAEQRMREINDYYDFPPDRPIDPIK